MVDMDDASSDSMLLVDSTLTSPLCSASDRSASWMGFGRDMAGRVIEPPEAAGGACRGAGMLAGGVDPAPIALLRPVVEVEAVTMAAAPGRGGQARGRMSQGLKAVSQQQLGVASHAVAHLACLNKVTAAACCCHLLILPLLLLVPAAAAVSFVHP